jgi:Fe-Mn family superoxide dismutase
MAPATDPYQLPDLPYDYGALEPHVSGQIMELHHGKHHAAYVKGANETIDRLAEARAGDETAVFGALANKLAFNVSGHLLHSVFWQNLGPDGGGRPSGDLAAAIDDAFGGFDGFRRQLAATTTTIMGSGWGALVWEPAAERLMVAQIHDHQARMTPGNLPLLVIDGWEHAFYLQYQNRKEEWVEAVWNVVSWTDVEQRFEAARRARQDELLLL